MTSQTGRRPVLVVFGKPDYAGNEYLAEMGQMVDIHVSVQLKRRMRPLSSQY